VGDVLAAALPGLADRLLAEKIRGRWATIVGQDAARRSRPTELRGGALTVTVDNSPWLCEMTLRSAELLAAVRAHHGASVSSLRFSLGTAAVSAAPAARARPSPVARLSAEEERSVETIAASVADPALAASLRRLITKDFIARRRRGAVSPARREDT
jgi:hypothetical protein